MIFSFFISLHLLLTIYIAGTGLSKMNTIQLPPISTLAQWYVVDFKSRRGDMSAFA
jgi:hypothetical protein